MAKIIRREWTSTGPLGKHVRHTADGDTLEVPHNNRAERIRLNGIDCPEKGQAYGKRAKQAASELVFGKEVTLQTEQHVEAPEAVVRWLRGQGAYAPGTPKSPNHSNRLSINTHRHSSDRGRTRRRRRR
jgi:hypothetical protein